MPGCKVAVDCSVDALSAVVLRLHAGQRRRRLLHIRSHIEQHRVCGYMQNIVLIRFHGNIGRSDRVISETVPLQHSVKGLGSIPHLLLGELQR